MAKRTLPIAALDGQSIKTGRDVDQQAPALSARDRGRDESLKSVMGANGAMLVFFLSARIGDYSARSNSSKWNSIWTRSGSQSRRRNDSKGIVPLPGVWRSQVLHS
jgi:hypothetical protein